MTRKTGWEEETWNLTPARTCAHRILHMWDTKCFSASAISLNRHGKPPQTCISRFGKWHHFESIYITHLHVNTLVVISEKKSTALLPFCQKRLVRSAGPRASTPAQSSSHHAHLLRKKPQLLPMESHHHHPAGSTSWPKHQLAAAERRGHTHPPEWCSVLIWLGGKSGQLANTAKFYWFTFLTLFLMILLLNVCDELKHLDKCYQHL